MKIASSTAQLESSHTKMQHREIQESLRSWIGGSQTNSGNERVSANLPVATVQISENGKAAQSSEANAIQDNMDAVENDPMLRLIRAMIKMLTGHDAQVFDTSELQIDSTPASLQDPNQLSASTTLQQPVGYGVAYDHHESYSETEQTTFEATGVVRTADGKEINFSLSLSMERSYHEESNLSIRLGDARQKKDPLVISFGTNSTQLTSQRFEFDLDSDGKSDNINFVAGGSGFLAFDRNGDGKINNGSELFGARSGNGFSELAALDSDHNGWIDENDPSYEQLLVWTKDATEKDQLLTLKQVDVGALSLAHIETPFDLKDRDNLLQGQIRSSGIYLHENGDAGTIQQIDLTV